MRVDYWLRNKYPQLTRRHAQESLRAGLVRGPGGQRLAPGAQLGADQLPDCTPLDRHLAKLALGNAAIKLPILYHDEYVVAVDKPAGMPSHPISLLDYDTVSHWALAHYPEIRAWATECQPTVSPHRLDTDTSGILLVARTREAYEKWRKAFSGHDIEKTYLAWCWGQGPGSEVTCSLPMMHAPGDARRMRAVPPGSHDSGRVRLLAAETRIRTVRQEEDFFLAEIRMCTGVTHQVRVHMATLGWPLMGDNLYDQAHEQRLTKFRHHQLRCIRLEGGGVDIRAHGEAFIRCPAAE